MGQSDDHWGLSLSAMLCTVGALALLVHVILKRIKYYSELPPGPWGLPFLGYLPWMSDAPPHTKYLKLADHYGDVTSLTLGGNLVVCLGSAELVRELFNRHDSTARPHTPLNNLMQGRGIVLSEGDLWTKQRQFLHRIFQNLGVNLKNFMKFEKVVLVEIDEMKMLIKRAAGTAIDPIDVLSRPVHNIICQLLMSYSFKEDDKKFTKFNERVREGMRFFSDIQFGEHIPAYLHLPGKKTVVKQIQRNIDELVNFHAEHIKERRLERMSKPVEERSFADMLDYYLFEIFEKDSKSNIFPGCQSKDDAVKQMIQVMNDLFSAGMETTRTTLAWLLVMMVREPAVAKAVRKELRDAVSPNEFVTLAHRSQLVYLEAVIFETMRRVSVVPLGTTHMNSAKWNIGDFTIPKGTHIVPLINKIHMDPKAFPDPECFMPERFLRDGKLEINPSFMAFGVGRRACLGMQLARMELILFFANIMNNFDFSLAEGEEVPSLDGVLSTTHAPRSYKLIFRPLEVK